MQRRSIAICTASTVFVILAAVIAIICVVFVNNNNNDNNSNTQEASIGYVSSSLDDNSIILPWDGIDENNEAIDVQDSDISTTYVGLRATSDDASSHSHDVPSPPQVEVSPDNEDGIDILNDPSDSLDGLDRPLAEFRSITNLTRTATFTTSQTNNKCTPTDQSLLRLILKTDLYPYETSWEILRIINTQTQQSITVGRGPPANTNYEKTTNYIGDFCLDPGAYIFKIKDKSLTGDGICCEWGPGSYTLDLNGERIVTSSDEDFTVMKYDFLVSPPSPPPTRRPTSNPTTRRPTSRPVTKPPSERFNIYYGYLHSHTGVSDGEGTPHDAYSQAKEAGLDFFGTSDHDYWPQDMSIKNWELINRVADSFNEDGVFTSLVGFEWTSDEADYGHELGRNHGHFTVVGTPEWCNAGHENCNTLDEFVNWLDAQPTGLAMFNHPGQYGSDSFEQFNFPKTQRIVGMELWNRDKDYYSREGTDGVRYYDEALQKGWYIGAGGGQDNHDRSWGTKNTSRMAVLAKTLSGASIMEALKARRYYSTLIDGVRIQFQCDNQDMGSIIKSVKGGVHSCTFDVTSNHVFTWIELIRNGSPVVSIENPTFPFTTTLRMRASGGSDYIYAVLWQGDDWKVVSSPIFFKT